MEESLKNDIEEVELEKTTEPSLIKDYFKDDQSGKIKELADLFGQSETELKKEFASFKAKKVYKKLNYFIDSRFRLNGDVMDMLNVASKYGFYGVTVYPTILPLAVSLLYGGSVKVRTLIDYPSGESSFKSKKYALRQAYKMGADEFLISLSSYLVKNGDEKDLFKCVKKLVKHGKERKVSALLDTSVLSRVEIEKAINLLWNSGIYSLVLYGSKGVLDKELLSECVHLASGKVEIECFGEVNCSEIAVSTLLDGVNGITSEYCEEIVLDFSKKINACEQDVAQPLDKSSKE